MGKINITLELRPATLKRNLARFPDQVDGYIHGVMEYQATKGEGLMKTLAPWTDRTGNARSGLGAVTEWVPRTFHAIRLFHRVPYGIFLEVRWAGKYAIILPTLQRLGPDTMRMLSKMFSRLSTGGGSP